MSPAEATTIMRAQWARTEAGEYPTVWTAQEREATALLSAVAESAHAARWAGWKPSPNEDYDSAFNPSRGRRA